MTWYGVHSKVPTAQHAQHAAASVVVAALRAHDLAPALQWSALHRKALRKIGSSLEFKLRALASDSLTSIYPHLN